MDHMKKVGFDQQKVSAHTSDQINIIDYFVKKCSIGNIKKVKEILEKFPNVRKFKKLM